MRDEAQAMWRDGCSIFSERSRRLARGGLEYTVGVQSAAFQGLSVTGVEFPCRSGSCSACWKSQGATPGEGYPASAIHLDHDNQLCSGRGHLGT